MHIWLIIIAVTLKNQVSTILMQMTLMDWHVINLNSSSSSSYVGFVLAISDHTKTVLTLTVLWANLADDKLMMFFFFLGRQFAWNVKSCFLENIRKLIQNVVIWNVYPACKVLRNASDICFYLWKYIIPKISTLECKGKKISRWHSENKIW